MLLLLCSLLSVVVVFVAVCCCCDGGWGHPLLGVVSPPPPVGRRALGISPSPREGDWGGGESHPPPGEGAPNVWVRRTPCPCLPDSMSLCHLVSSLECWNCCVTHSATSRHAPQFLHCVFSEARQPPADRREDDRQHETPLQADCSFCLTYGAISPQPEQAQ